MPNKINAIAYLFVFCIVTAACSSPAAVSPTPAPTEAVTATPAPTDTPLPTPTVPTATPTNTPTTTPTPTPETISVDNVTNLQLVERRGKGAIEDIAWSPDDDLIAVATGIGVYLYDSHDLSIIQWLETDMHVLSLAFDPDGSRLALGGMDGMWQLWDIEQFTRISSSRLADDYEISDIALSNGGDLVATWAMECCIGLNSVARVRLWNPDTGEEVGFLENPTVGYSIYATGVAFTAQEDMIVMAGTGYQDFSVRIWDKSYRLLVTLGSHNGVIVAVESPPQIPDWSEGPLFATADSAGRVNIWKHQDTGTAVLWRQISAQPDGVPSLAFSADGQFMATGGGNQNPEVSVWDTNSGQLVNVLQGHQGMTTGLALSADGSRLVSGSVDGTLRLWEVETGQQLASTSGHMNTGFYARLEPELHLLIVSWGLYNTGAHGLPVWDIDSAELRFILEGGSDWIISGTASPDGNYFAAASFDKLVRIWDAASGDLLHTLSGHFDNVNEVAFSPDSSILASGDQKGAVRLWDVQSGAQLTVLGPQTGWIFGLGFSPDGRYVVGTGAQPAVRVWEVETRNLLFSFDNHADSVGALAFSPDSQLLATGDFKGKIWVLDIGSGQAIQELVGHDGYVECLAFDSTGQMVASGGRNGMFRVWEARTGALLHEFRAHSSRVMNIVFDNEGRYVYTVGGDGTIATWEVSSSP